MKPSQRILIVGVIIELLLAGLAGFLLMQLSSGAMRPATSLAEAKATITTVLGGVMGGLGGLLAVIYVVLRGRGK